MVLFVGGGSRFAIGLTLKPMADDLGWSRGTLGLAVALFLVVNAICLFLAGRLSDRFGPRYILGGGLVVGALGIGLMSRVSAPWQALLLYSVVFAIGNGVASITPVGVMVSRWFPVRTGLANAAAISGVGIGQLVMIAGLAVVLAETKKAKGDWGYDAEIGEFCHLLERGIMDPAKVTRAAVENAVSVASMVLTTESLISDIPEEKPAMPAAPPMDY